MSALTAKIANVVDRKALRIERELRSLRNQEEERMRAARQLEQERYASLRRMRQIGSAEFNTTTTQHLIDLSQDARHCERSLQRLQEQLSVLRREQESSAAHRRKRRVALLSLRRKAEFIRDHAALQARKAIRRRIARDLAGS